MKEDYSKPKVEVLELNLEGALCASVTGQNSAIIDDVTVDEEYKW